jgi:hypothetical protein
MYIMDASTMTGVITTALTSYGGKLVLILTAVIGIGVAYLIFRFGWRKVKGSTR